MSALMFSGAAQILAAQLIAAGAPRRGDDPHLLRRRPALPDVQRRDGAASRSRCRRAGATRSRSCSPTRRSPPAIRRFREPGDTRNGASYFLGTGVLLWTTWQVSCLAGYWLGNVIPAAWSLDFVVPLCFLALLVPALEDGPTRVAALAAGIAVVALDALPMRLSLVCAGLSASRRECSGESRRRGRERARSTGGPSSSSSARSTTCRGCRSSRCLRGSRCRLSSRARSALRARGHADGDRRAGRRVFRTGDARLHVRQSETRRRVDRGRRRVAHRERRGDMGVGMIVLWLMQWALTAAGSGS